MNPPTFGFLYLEISRVLTHSHVFLMFWNEHRMKYDIVDESWGFRIRYVYVAQHPIVFVSQWQRQ